VGLANASSFHFTLLDELSGLVGSLTDMADSFVCAGWFKGLSSGFLACRTARLLVLAGTDRLDKELMIGQMQGKFQMEVIPDVGHMLQEVRKFYLLEIVLN
jgi:hypothetical protein